MNAYTHKCIHTPYPLLLLLQCEYKLGIYTIYYKLSNCQNRFLRYYCYIVAAIAVRCYCCCCYARRVFTSLVFENSVRGRKRCMIHVHIVRYNKTHSSFKNKNGDCDSVAAQPFELTLYVYMCVCICVYSCIRRAFDNWVL